MLLLRVRVLVALVLVLILQFGHCHPTYIGCDATVTALHKPSFGQQLRADVGMQVMGGNIVTHPSDTLDVTDATTGNAIRHYVVGTQHYRVTLVRNVGAPSVKAYCWASAGRIVESNDVSCPRYHRVTSSVREIVYTWQPPVNNTPNVTLQCFYATGYGNGLSSASTLLGTEPGFFQAVTPAPNATAAGLADTGCRNVGWVGTKTAQRWMYWGLVMLWAGMVSILLFGHKPVMVGIAPGALLGIVVFTTVWAASPFGGDSVPAMAALASVLVVFAFVLRSSDVGVLSSVLTGAAATFLLVAWFTSFHHWCNGEQGWDDAYGSWGDYDTYQGTIPWWALSLALALAVAVPGPSQELYNEHRNAFKLGVVWFCIALVVGCIVGGKGVAVGMMAACASPFILIMVWYWHKKYRYAVIFIVAGVVLSSALAHNSTSYSDNSTIVQMMWCTIFALSWLYILFV